MTLTRNRYQQVTPTAIHSNGVAVSVPIYIALTRDQNKQLLNAFRTAVQERGEVVEQELGMNEENLRHALFARNGIPERLALRLQAVTGVELVTKEQIEQTFQEWVAHLYQ